MYTSSGTKATPILEAAKEDPRVQELVEAVRKGQISAEAPSGYDPVVWTPADEARLDAALAKRSEKRRAQS